MNKVDMEIQAIIIAVLVGLLLIVILTRRNRENFGGGAKFKITGRKNKCACLGNCDKLYATCRAQQGSYTKAFCDRERWACGKSCTMSDYGS